MSPPPLDNLHIFGIRHHGPGSARHLRTALGALQPDMVLVEGPPDADELLSWLAHPDMAPPVALIIYRPDQPKRAATYPFALFSPELQAIRAAFAQNTTVRFMDLPQAHLLATDESPQAPEAAVLQRLAKIAGYRSYERWWNQLIEQRQQGADLFAHILEMMQVARAQVEADRSIDDSALSGPARLAAQREAYMRQCIRQAQTEGYQRIAVVCGAWHGPALIDLHNETADQALLAGMPAVEVEMAWVPWTYGRLSNRSGYGAGLSAPGWYHHLWEMGQAGATPTELSINWLTKVANLLREADFDASSAHIIEAVRLAEALAAVRDLPLPGLGDLNEAVQAVFCFGDPAPLQHIQEKLIVSERMGAVPPDTPMVPLQRDLVRLQRELRLRPSPERSTLNLDLRNEMHLARSHLLHRLKLLNIPWGIVVPTPHKSGTYREVWRLEWVPDLAIRVIEASMWGNTVEDAAASYAEDLAERATSLSVLTQLLDDIILADLVDTIVPVMGRIDSVAALSSDIPLLMDALLPLAHILRYGSVRLTDKSMIQHVVDGLLTRICVGLPNTCAALNDEAAADMFERIVAVADVIATLQDDDHRQLWQDTLRKLLDQKQMHGLIAGRACRLLLDGSVLTAAEAANRLERALSPQTLPTNMIDELVQAAFWIEGFLRESGLIILHDQALWQILDAWLLQLDDQAFMNVLPLLRRTFATFSESVRQQMSERVRPRTPTSDEPDAAQITAPAFDAEAADTVLPLIAQLLGLKE